MKGRVKVLNKTAWIRQMSATFWKTNHTFWPKTAGSYFWTSVNHGSPPTFLHQVSDNKVHLSAARSLSAKQKGQAGIVEINMCVWLTVLRGAHRGSLVRKPCTLHQAVTRRPGGSDDKRLQNTNASKTKSEMVLSADALQKGLVGG